MSRVQLALNVSDLDEAVAFYSKLFGAEPAKRRPGYANFAIADPPLKLVLMETEELAGRASPARSTTSASRWRPPTRWPPPPAALSAEGLETEVQDQTTCCFAVQDKVWVERPRRGAVGGLHRARRRPGGVRHRRRWHLLHPRGRRRHTGAGTARARPTSSSCC